MACRGNGQGTGSSSPKHATEKGIVWDLRAAAGGIQAGTRPALLNICGEIVIWALDASKSWRNRYLLYRRVS